MPPTETDDGADAPVAGCAADGDWAADPVSVASIIKIVPAVVPIAGLANLTIELLTQPSPSSADSELNALDDIAHEAAAVPVGLRGLTLAFGISATHLKG